MHTHSNTITTCDVLILGSGIAGLLLAHELSQLNLRIILACKASLIDSNTACAQGGLSAVTGANPLDSPQLHLQDTIAAGAGLTDEFVARTIVYKAADLIERLSQLGVNFDRQSGKLDCAREGGHSCARVLHSKDASGKAISISLIQQLSAASNVQLMENTFALDLLMNQERCCGVSTIQDGAPLDIYSKYTVLATGGLGQVFARTTNPIIATGDGIAMAYRAGAQLIDMEFVQFHPTALAQESAPPALISEAVRGAGATLIDRNGERFSFKFHKDGELATRDVVARSIYTTMHEQNTSRVWLDLRPIGATTILSRFPNIVETCRSYGVDPLLQPVPIAPAAHYFMGGIYTDEHGQTSIPGLLAIGECASTGLHGANRLASNSLLEGGVMAMQVAQLIAAAAPSKRATSASQASWQDSNFAAIGGAVMQAPYAMPSDLLKFRQSMFTNVGLERSASQLNAILNSMPALIEYRVPAQRDLAEAANIAVLGWLIARSALARKESRGAHWRSDYPATNDTQFRRRLLLSKNSSSWVEAVGPVGLVAV